MIRELEIYSSYCIAQTTSFRLAKSVKQYRPLTAPACNASGPLNQLVAYRLEGRRRVECGGGGGVVLSPALMQGGSQTWALLPS